MPAINNILFNALKHHRRYIREQAMAAGPAAFTQLIKVLGNSQMDVYYGMLNLPVLYQEVIVHINNAGITDEETYYKWLEEHNGYIEITLSDTSRWILLPGNEPGKYIHLHPARYSPHSMRVKATILKTALACMVYLPEDILPDIRTLNQVRKDVLQLSPVKDLVQCEHLWKVLRMLKEG